MVQLMTNNKIKLLFCRSVDIMLQKLLMYIEINNVDIWIMWHSLLNILSGIKFDRGTVKKLDNFSVTQKISLIVEIILIYSFRLK